MAIQYQVLGSPGRDNALLVRVDTGQSITRILFDCGDGCVAELGFGEIQAIDELFFSHLHMDHIGGFDSFFRCTFNRDAKPNRIWGPAQTSTILQHRFCGFWWNLHAGQPGTWQVCDILPDRIERSRFEIAEAFATRHSDGIQVPSDGCVLATPEYEIRALPLKHNGPCLGYLLRERSSVNVRTERLAELGLKPGAWLKALKGGTAETATDPSGNTLDLIALRRELLVETPGDSIAYLTDFLLDDETCAFLELQLRGRRTVVCEAQYRHADLALARRNSHTTTSHVAQLAARAGIGELVLFHLSDRYDRSTWLEMLDECRRLFPATNFPTSWQLGPGA